MPTYIITGAPGTGKTSLINELNTRGYIGLEEVPRKLLKDKVAEKMGISPFKNLKEFANLVFDKMFEQVRSIPDNDKIYFLDRGLPDVFAYLQNSNIPIPNKYYTQLKMCKFNKLVFVCTPWENIYINDPERPYPFDETVELHKQLVLIYEKLNFNIVELPKGSLPQRADFIELKLKENNL